MNSPPEIALFLGRLHVLLVHLPITLILLVALLEWLARSRRFPHANANSGIILALAVPAAVFSVVCGWLLSWSGGYDAGLLRWHRWTGVATASVCIISALLYSLNLKKPYRFSLFSNILLLILATHLGGSLTHGRDYLVRYAPGPFRSWLGLGATSQTAESASTSDPARKELFTSLVHPILQANCVGCHGPEKTKGHLRLDSFEAILKGGENGPAIIPGNAAESLLLKRLQLPITSDDHMPPEGKPQPSADQIALLQWWIGAGAPTNKTAAQLNPPPNISRFLADLGAHGAAPAAQRFAQPMAAEKVAPLAAKIADEFGIVVTPIAQGEPWLQCNASVAGTNFGDQQLSALAPLRLNLRWLDLGGTAITDSALPQIAGMANLTRLHLERTAITDDGLKALAPLENLEYLNLYGTSIDDAALHNLKGLARLKQIYLWETKVSAEAAANFAKERIDTGQIARWQQEIEQLKTRIQEARFLIDTGAGPPPVNATNAGPATNAPNDTVRAATASVNSSP